MATVKPFRALRPQAAAAAEFASLPYDVMDAAEAREMVAQKPQSFLRVTRAEVDLPENTDAHAAVVYEQAGKKMAEYVQSGLLLRDETPCYYVYQQQMGDNVQTGKVRLPDQRADGLLIRIVADRFIQRGELI